MAQDSQEQSTLDDNFLSKLCPSEATALKNIFVRLVHWKTVFLPTTKNKTGYKVVKTLNFELILFQSTNDNGKIKMTLTSTVTLPPFNSSPNWRHKWYFSHQNYQTDLICLMIVSSLNFSMKRMHTSTRKTYNSKRTRDELKNILGTTLVKTSNALSCLNEHERGGVLWI